MRCLIVVFASAAFAAPTLRPVPGGGGQLTVEDAKTVGHLVLRPGLQVEHGQVSEAGGTLSTTHLLGAMGLGDRVQIGLDVPIHVVAGDSVAGDLRIVPKARLFRHGDISGAMSLGVGVPTAEGDGQDRLTLDPTMVLAADAGALEMAFNTGYRWMPGGHNDAFTYGVGASVPLWRDEVQVLLEGRGERPADGRQAAGLEALGGVRLRVADLSLTGGGGGGGGGGRSTSDWRVLGAVGWRWEDQDLDNDGVVDAFDQCPGKREDLDGFADHDGCPDLDNDHDTIADRYDQCPDTPETRNGYLDRDGCPDAAQAQRSAPRGGDAQRSPAPPTTPPAAATANWSDKQTTLSVYQTNSGQAGRVEVRGEARGEARAQALAGSATDAEADGVRLVHGRIDTARAIGFVGRTTALTPEGRGVVAGVAGFLVSHPELARLRVCGHTASTGDAARNLDLSRRRAATVLRALVDAGVAPARLIAVGRGDEQPLESNRTAEGRARNHRVEILVHSRRLARR